MNKTTIYSTIIASTIAILSILAFTSSQAGAAPPSDVSIDDVSLAEGNAGLTAFTFTVTRSDNTDAISVDLATSDGTATTADNDYPAAGGTLNFQAGGLLSKAIPVQVNGDTKVEPDETFFVDLSNCVGCTITDNQGQGTIQNDDAAPSQRGANIWAFGLEGTFACSDGIEKTILPLGFRIEFPETVNEIRLSGPSSSSMRLRVYQATTDGNNFEVRGLSDGGNLCFGILTADKIPFEYTMKGDCAKPTVVTFESAEVTGSFMGNVACFP